MHIGDDSFILWHKRLGHISKESVLKLSKAKLIPELNFTTATECVDCVKGKMTNFRKLDAKRCHDLLEIIHTDICGPFPTKTICGNSYFVNFIDDFSRFCYTYLLSEKSPVLDCFKIYKTEVEKQLGKTINIVRSNRGGEYFGRYSEAGQCKGPFAFYLEQQGIVAQYTTPRTPQQNGVSERRNRTLIGMVRSMMTRSKLPRFLWGEALKTTTYILNRVPCKAVSPHISKFGMGESLVLITSIFGDVKLRLEYTIQMRRNWTQGLNRATSLATQRNQKASNFIVPKLILEFKKLTMPGFLKIKML
ncbi:hypothetical protein C1H46_043696 [Malus baccata]|uniref:Integrase catalytic domain-containing protein n=1 Tax=Malus baccata TaxID=106549 RepID=A0A540K9D7_MALBA|nr:hypothetical protein C1H46_043696 [Malus baccata]